MRADSDGEDNGDAEPPTTGKRASKADTKERKRGILRPWNGTMTDEICRFMPMIDGLYVQVSFPAIPVLTTCILIRRIELGLVMSNPQEETGN